MAAHIPEIQQKVRETLVDDLAAAIKYLQSQLHERSPKQDELFLLLGRFNDARRIERQGTSDADEIRRIDSQVRRDLLSIVSTLTPADFTAPKSNADIRQGHLLYRIPHLMPLAAETRCIVRIALDAEVARENIPLDTHTVEKTLKKFSKSMQVELSDPSGGRNFSIRPDSRCVQTIDLDAEEYTEWRFYVTPLRAGQFMIEVKVAVIELVDGEKEIRERVLEEEIQIVAEHQPAVAKSAAEQPLKNGGPALAFADAPTEPPKTVFKKAERWQQQNLPAPSVPPTEEKDTAPPPLKPGDVTTTNTLFTKPTDQAPTVTPANPVQAATTTPPTESTPAKRKSGLTMVAVPGGTFSMGSPTAEQDRPTIEYPHSVTLDAYNIGKYEVTQADWRAVMVKDPAELAFKGCDDCPVESVSWNDVQDFITKLNQQTGGHYRLPTEAEWEYAARGGGKVVRFGNGSNIADPKQINFDGRASSKTSYSVAGEYRSKTIPVGSLNSPNALGLHDMSGNIWEWCSDWYGGDYYQNSPNSNPPGPAFGSRRVMRGGSWLNVPQFCRAANRDNNAPGNRYDSGGFRLARTK